MSEIDCVSRDRIGREKATEVTNDCLKELNIGILVAKLVK